MKLLITGAAGNLGSLFARHCLERGIGPLRLMVFRRDLPPDLRVPGKTETVRADLGRRETLGAAVESVDAIVHFAGVLFKARPERMRRELLPTLKFKTIAEGIATL